MGLGQEVHQDWSQEVKRFFTAHQQVLNQGSPLSAALLEFEWILTENVTSANVSLFFTNFLILYFKKTSLNLLYTQTTLFSTETPAVIAEGSRKAY